MLKPAPKIAFFSQRDGYRTVLRLWDTPHPAAEVILLHGIVSHGGWYLESGAHLAAAGYRVHLLDRRGSGLNPARRGDVDHCFVWMRDVADYLRVLPSDVPRILLGVSFGGTLAAGVAIWRPHLISGLGLLCPGIFSRQQAGPLRRAAIRALRRIGLGRRLVPIPLRKPSLFTHTPSEQRYVAQDPLTLWHMTIAMADAHLDLLRYVEPRPESIRVPTLLMLAGKDPITKNAETRSYLRRIDHPDRRLVEYPDAAHTLEFEPDRRAYLRDLTAWCDHVITRHEALPTGSTAAER